MAVSPYHRIELLNNTEKSYHFAIYQRPHPKSPALRSVAWKVRGVPPRGVFASASFVEWKAGDYGVCIADWDEKRERYLERQIIGAQLGKAYRVSTVDCDDIPSICPKPAGSTDERFISLTNESDETLVLGITLDLSLVAVQSVEAGGSLRFCAAESTAYCVSCYRYIQAGQVAVLTSLLTPVDVSFDDEYEHCKVVATNHNGKRLLRVSKFCM